MTRDRNEIRRQSNEALDRRIESFDTETRRIERSDDFWKTLRAGDHDKLNWMLDVPTSGSGLGELDFGTNATPKPQPVPTAQEQLHDHSSRFEAAVEASGYVDYYTAKRWMDQVRSIDLDHYAAGHVAVDQIELDLIEVRADSKPTRDIFSMSVSNEMQHMNAFDRIESELRWIRRILEHVERYVEEGDEG